jgi:tartrate dehydrogenase/decarboxylase/D-malate dehydrogenase
MPTILFLRLRIERALASGTAFTPDLGGTATTAQVTQAVCAALEGKNL